MLYLASFIEIYFIKCIKALPTSQFLVCAKWEIRFSMRCLRGRDVRIGRFHVCSQSHLFLIIISYRQRRRPLTVICGTNASLCDSVNLPIAIAPHRPRSASLITHNPIKTKILYLWLLWFDREMSLTEYARCIVIYTVCFSLILSVVVHKNIDPI